MAPALFKKELLFAVLFFSAVTYFAQHQVGIELNAGTSHITASSSLSTTYLRPSGSVGFNWLWQSKKRLYVSFSVLCSQIEGEEHHVIPEQTYIFDSTSVQISYDIRTKRHLTYLSFPLVVGFKYRKWHGGLGLRYSQKLKMNAESHERVFQGGTEYIYDSRTDKPYLDIFDIGFEFNVGFRATKQIHFHLNYYHGSNNIHGYNYWPLTNTIPLGPNPWNYKVRQLCLGVRYNLWIKNRP